MKLSEREKKLFIVLAILVVLAVPYFLVMSPLFGKIRDVQMELIDLKSEYKELTALQENSDVYENATEDLRKKTQELLMRFPEDLSQEATLMFIQNAENLFHISLYQLAFGEEVTLQLAQETETAQMNGAELTETGTYSAKSTSTVFTYEASYNDFKRFINYIEQFEDRMIISDLSASYMEETDQVHGSFTLIQYAICNPDRRLPETMVGLELGSENIFTEAEGKEVADTELFQQYDYFVMLCNAQADIDAKIVGKANDASRQSYLTSTDNDKETILITFTGSAGEYRAMYSIGDKQYPEESIEEGIAFTAGNSLDLQIISSPRIGDGDHVSADLELVNQTDMTLHVTIINDDSTYPRVTMKEMTGDIKLHNK